VVGTGDHDAQALSADTIRRAHRVCPVTAVQSEYHLMFRKPEAEVFSTLQELGVSLVAYSPLNRGFLGGTLTEYADMNTNDIRGAWPRFTSAALRANTRIVEVLNEFGKTRGMTSSQVALAWMLSKHPFIVPLFGTTKLSHLEEHLRAADFTLTRDEIADVEGQVSQHLRRLLLRQAVVHCAVQVKRNPSARSNCDRIAAP
jgi:aryl-alcohol dehydrogenase-like predicted oxidoreductase